MEILLIEDSLMDANVAIRALEGRVKHHLTLVRDGDEAAEFLLQQGKFARAPRPDLILLDLVLPGKDGLELLAEIRANSELERLPVVVLTSSEEPSDRQRCDSLRVDSFMSKPVNLDKFLQVVHQLKRFWLEDVVLPGLDG